MDGLSVGGCGDVSLPADLVCIDWTSHCDLPPAHSPAPPGRPTLTSASTLTPCTPTAPGWRRSSRCPWGGRRGGARGGLSGGVSGVRHAANWQRQSGGAHFRQAWPRHPTTACFSAGGRFGGHPGAAALVGRRAAAGAAAQGHLPGHRPRRQTDAGGGGESCSGSRRLQRRCCSAWQWQRRRRAAQLPHRNGGGGAGGLRW